MALLSDDEVDRRIAEGPWRREGKALVRDLKLDDFCAAMALVNAVAETAEAAGHHPDILLHGWNNVRLTLSTHSEGGITGADLSMAAAIDGLTA